MTLPRGVEIVIGDLQEPSTLARAMVGVHTVFHLAAAFRQAHLPYEEYVAVNVTATGALVFAAAAAGVRRFVHVSTVGVHGNVTGIANEDAPFRPGDWYQETKARGELIARDSARHKHLSTHRHTTEWYLRTRGHAFSAAVSLGGDRSLCDDWSRRRALPPDVY